MCTYNEYTNKVPECNMIMLGFIDFSYLQFKKFLITFALKAYYTLWQKEKNF